MKKSFQIITILFLSIVSRNSLAQLGGGAAGSSAAGSGGAGGGSLLGFKYVMKPKDSKTFFLKNVFDEILGVSQNFNNDDSTTLIQMDVLESDELSMNSSSDSLAFRQANLVTYALYQRYKNQRIYKYAIDEVSILDDTIKKTYSNVKVKYRKSRSGQDKAIKVFLKTRSPDGNTFSFKLWNSNDSAWVPNANRGHCCGAELPIILPGDKHAVWGIDSLFNYQIHWIDRYKKPYAHYKRPIFNIPFNTRYFIPITTPVSYLFGNRKNAHRWQSNFLTAGMAYGWGHGRTKFFKNDQYQPKNFYIGTGFLASISAAMINKSDFSANPKNPGDTSEYKAAITRLTSNTGTTYTAPQIQFGIHVGESFGSIQLIQAAGLGWVLGYPAQYWNYQGKPWIGFGIGLSLFNFAVPTAPGGGAGH